MPPPSAIDPLSGPRFALRGRIVTMNAQSQVIDDGVLYVDAGVLIAVRTADTPPPPTFAATKVIATGGTIYPGLIELHNHLAYNALRLWDVPKAYGNRDQWAGTPTYRRLITGPMTILGSSSELLPAVVRYVECKCLVAGVTTSQGVELFSSRGARRYYRGIVRNVEQTDDPALPEAATKIADVEAVDAQRFLARLGQRTCFLLHLSEGRDAAARSHFLALHLTSGAWAIGPSLAGIHCAALRDVDFAIMAQQGASMVWSPLSNLLLYGQTADVRAAKAAGVRIGLGSDWAPSGSKNLLGELKVAKAVSDEAGGIFTDVEILAMATRTGAKILGWSSVLGSLEDGKHADVIVVSGTSGDAYGTLFKATEADLTLVLIAGVPRYGTPALMQKLGAAGSERLTVGGRQRVVDLAQASADPLVGAITLGEARSRLRDALATLPELAARKEASPGRRAATRSLESVGRPTWFLALDETEETGLELRPRLPLPNRRGLSGPAVRATRAAPSQPLSKILTPLRLDGLTAADDHEFIDVLKNEKNLPAFLWPALQQLF